jgi:poly-gamma-glutamate synthase PgsB/CapB
MTPLGVALLVLAALWLGHLGRERILLGRHRRAVPLRIAVTGTRGKTSVTRLLAAVLRQSGRIVLAKSTGSEAACVLPDGSEEEVRRRGPPSIIEQKRLLRRAAKLGADTVVVEIMSIRPENHLVEARKLLVPQLVLVTNFRVDHVEAQGRTREEVASVLALDVPAGARALVPESEWHQHFADRVTFRGGTVEKVAAGSGIPAEGIGQFGANLDLVCAAARSMGIGDDVIRAGVRGARGDLGALGVWRYPRPAGREPWLVVNAFAANDPESTLRIHDRVMSECGLDAGACIGLLSLRADRGDRTLQWIDSLRAGSLLRFRRLYVAGLHARALAHRLRRAPGAERVHRLGLADPRALMDRMLDAEGPAGGLLFGFGNIGGLGESLVRHWRKAGDSYGV